MPLYTRILAAFLRLFFKLLYHQFSWTYDWVAASVSLGRWKDWVMAVPAYLEGPRVLEIGHGPGHLQVALHSKGIQTFGLDESAQMATQAYRRLKRSNFTPLLARGYAQSLPFPSETFQQVVATFPSEYIAHPLTISEIYRTLKPGGKLVLLPIAWITGQRRFDKLAAWLFRFTKQAPILRGRSAAAWLTQPLEQAGFELKVDQLHLAGSLLLLIQAVKPGSKS